MTCLWPVAMRAMRSDASTDSVPLPSMRNISTFGMWRLISRAMSISDSWSRPVTGPHSFKSSITFSRMTG